MKQGDRWEERVAFHDRLRSALQTAPDAAALYAAVASELRQTLGCARAMVSLYDEDYRAGTTVATSSDKPTRFQAGTRYTLSDQDAPAVRALVTPIWIPDLTLVQPAPEVVRDLIDEGLRSFLSHPILMNGRVIGAVSAAGSGDQPAYEPGLRRLEDAAVVLTLVLHARELEAERDRTSAARERNQEQVEATQRTLSLVAAATGLAVWEHHLPLDRVWCSEPWKEQLGWGADDEFPGTQSWLDGVHPADRRRVALLARGILPSGESRFTCEYRLIRPNSRVRWMHLLGVVDRDARERPLTVTAVQLDLTNLKSVETALRSSNQQIQAFSLQLEAARVHERTELAGAFRHELGDAVLGVSRVLERLIERLGRTTLGQDELMELQNGLKLAQEAVSDTLQMARRLAQSLYPRVLDDLGLCAALEWLAHDFRQRHGIDSILVLPASEPRLDRVSRSMLFRIAQEALSNAREHPGAPRISLALQSGRRHACLEVTGEYLRARGSARAIAMDRGIKNMRGRAALLGGKLTIRSVRPTGTRLRVSLPLGGERLRANDDGSSPAGR